jgi:glycerol kinase
MGKVIIALDQGTTSSRALAVNEKGEVLAMSQQEFAQHYPQQGWVEHDPIEIWESQEAVFQQVLDRVSGQHDIQALGITNQRETIVAWDKETGQPLYNALVWQDQRTASACAQLSETHADQIKTSTGLVVDSYFSASKMKWLLNNVPEVQKASKEMRLAFGTVDSWLIWKMTEGKVHVTDTSNASRTMLYNIHKHGWDPELLLLFEVPEHSLPQVLDSNAHFGDYIGAQGSIPIKAVMGDQQSALYGQLCWNVGEVKNTYGTGCFALMNTGPIPKEGANLLTSIAWSINGKTTYCLEGSVFIGGAAIQWLRDKLHILEDAASSEAIAEQAEDKELVVVPAFSGLGAPHWDMNAKGAVFGLTRDITTEDLTKATLESIAFQSAELIETMKSVSGEINSLKVDGGASANNYLMQLQSDLLRIQIDRPVNIESTAMGVVFMAGVACGLWKEDEIESLSPRERTFTPHKDEVEVQRLMQRWSRAVEALKHWSSNE